MISYKTWIEFATDKRRNALKVTTAIWSTNTGPKKWSSPREIRIAPQALQPRIWLLLSLVDIQIEKLLLVWKKTLKMWIFLWNQWYISNLNVMTPSLLLPSLVEIHKEKLLQSWTNCKICDVLDWTQWSMSIVMTSFWLKVVNKVVTWISLDEIWLFSKCSVTCKEGYLQCLIDSNIPESAWILQMGSKIWFSVENFQDLAKNWG